MQLAREFRDRHAILFQFIHSDAICDSALWLKIARVQDLTEFGPGRVAGSQFRKIAQFARQEALGFITEHSDAPGCTQLHRMARQVQPELVFFQELN